MRKLTINDREIVPTRLAVSPVEAGRLAGVGRTTIYKAIGSGALPSLKIGRRRLILVCSLTDWLATAMQLVENSDNDRAPSIQKDVTVGRRGRQISRVELQCVVGDEAGQYTRRDFT